MNRLEVWFRRMGTTPALEKKKRKSRIQEVSRDLPLIIHPFLIVTEEQ